jgi:hypothetical protein
VNTRILANIVLMAGGVLALAALWHVSFGPAGPRQIAAATPWNVQHAVLAGVAAILFAALGLRPAGKTAVALIGLAAVAAMYTAEIALAGAGSGLIARSTPVWNLDRTSPERMTEIAAGRERGVKIDMRDQSEILADLRERGVDAVPAVMIADILRAPVVERPDETTALGMLLPMGAVSNVLTVLCNESGEYVTYTSDEHGFRNPTGVWSSSRADLAAVGQSLTQGYCVADGKGFVDLLRAHRGVTLNLGMSGESSLLQLGAIKEYLPRYAPKVVLWFFTEGIDLPDLYEESTHPQAMRYLEPAFSQRLLDRQPEIDSGLRHLVAQRESRARESKMGAAVKSPFVEPSWGLLKLWNLREKLELMYGIKSDSVPWSITQPSIRNLLSQTLAQAQAVTRGWDGALYFVYLPSWNRYRNGPRVSERERQRVLSLVAGLGIPVIDVQPAFQAHHDPLSLFPFRRFGHYNDAGNRVVADTVLKSLSAQERTRRPTGHESVDR